MPLYEYVCKNKKCELFETIQAIPVGVEERNEQVCGKCGEPLTRHMSRTSFRIK